MYGALERMLTFLRAAAPNSNTTNLCRCGAPASALSPLPQDPLLEGTKGHALNPSVTRHERIFQVLETDGLRLQLGRDDEARSTALALAY